METSVVVGLCFLSFLGGMVLVVLAWFFLFIDKKDERDDLIDRSQELATLVQKKLEAVMIKIRTLQEQYVNCKHQCSEKDTTIDELTVENEQLRQSNQKLRTK